MLNKTIERINKLRSEAMKDPSFISSAKAHEKAINQDEGNYPSKRKRKLKKSAKTKQTVEPVQLNLIDG